VTDVRGRRHRDRSCNVSTVKPEEWAKYPELHARFRAIAERERSHLLERARNDPHHVEAEIFRNLEWVLDWPLPEFVWWFPSPIRS